MSNVTLRIGGRDYMVACAAGEEDHVIGLGQQIDAKIQSMGGVAHSETRQLLFAALLLADDLHEKGGAAPSTPTGDADQYADALEAFAERLEACAQALEG